MSCTTILAKAWENATRFHDDGTDDNRDSMLLRPEFFAVRVLEGMTVEGPERDIVRATSAESCRKPDRGLHALIVDAG